MSDIPEACPHNLSLLIGPSREGLWIVCDTQGVCGAVFAGRDDALQYARSECEAAQPRGGEWRLVASLDLRALFAQSAKAA